MMEGEMRRICLAAVAAVLRGARCGGADFIPYSRVSPGVGETALP
jgi:hypothetical protein